jgi:hypothetical protein
MLRYAAPFALRRSLLRCSAVTAQDPIFCGRCGTPNPGGNQFCRKCGHRLADDVVDVQPAPAQPEPPRSPVAGITVERFPLVDPETGEEIAPPPVASQRPSLAPGARDDSLPAPRRSSVILWSLAVHFVVTCVLGLATLVVVSQVGDTMSPQNVQDLLARSEDIRARYESQQLDQEHAQIEERDLLESHGVIRLFLILSGPVLLGFLVSGFVAGRLWRPRVLLDVALSGVLIGGLCSLCLFNPLVWPLAFILSLVGAMLGRRW